MATDALFIASIFIGRDASAEFFKGSGTALSAGLVCIAAQAVFTVLSLHGGRAGTVGDVGLIVVGAGAIVGALGERVTYRILSLLLFDPTKAAIESVGIFLYSGLRKDWAGMEEKASGYRFQASGVFPEACCLIPVAFTHQRITLSASCSSRLRPSSARGACLS